MCDNPHHHHHHPGAAAMRCPRKLPGNRVSCRPCPKRELWGPKPFLSCRKDLWLLPMKPRVQWDHCVKIRAPVHPKSPIQRCLLSWLSSKCTLSCLAVLEKREIGCTPALHWRVDREIWNQRLATGPAGKTRLRVFRRLPRRWESGSRGALGAGENPGGAFTQPPARLHHQLRQAGTFRSHRTLALSLPSVDQALAGSWRAVEHDGPRRCWPRGPCCLCPRSICAPQLTWPAPQSLSR